MSTWIDFRELRTTVKIADVLAWHHVEVRVKGDRASGFCPLPGHRSKGDGKRRSPSFSVELTKGIFHCFSCGGRGNVLDLFCLLQGLDPNVPAQLREGALLLQEKLGRTPASPKASSVKRGDAAAPATKPAENLIVNEPLDFQLKHLDPRHPYLASRGFLPETVDHFGLGYCAKGMLSGRIAIPLHDAAGRLIGYAGRLVGDEDISDENPKYRFPGARMRNGVQHEFHKSKFLYNGDRIGNPVQDLIVVEGFASVWWLWQNGYKHVVALMGSSADPTQIRAIESLLKPDGRLWIFTDGDQAGHGCAIGLLAATAQNRWVRWVCSGRLQPTDCDGVGLARLLDFGCAKQTNALDGGSV